MRIMHDDSVQAFNTHSVPVNDYITCMKSTAGLEAGCVVRY